jgi:hypothetical protein
MRRPGEELVTELPPLSSEDLRFDIDQEIRLTVVDLLRREEPKTILGLVIANPEGIDIKVLAEKLDVHPGIVGWRVEKLEDEGLAIGLKEEDAVKVLPLALYNERND